MYVGRMLLKKPYDGTFWKFLSNVITVETNRKWFNPAVVYLHVFAVEHMFSDLRVSSVLIGTTGLFLITLLPIASTSAQVKVSIFTESVMHEMEHLLH